MADDPGGPARVAVNAVHAKTGGGITYLRNMLPLLAAEEGIALHLFAAEGTLAALAPIDARVRVHRVAPWPGFAGLAAWEQLRLPGLLRRAGIEVTFSPANYGPLAAPRPVVLLRNAFGMILRDRRWSLRLYWTLLAAMTWLSLVRCRRVLAVSAYARRTLVPGPLAPLRRRVAIVPHGVAPVFAPEDGAAPHADEAPFLLAVADLYPQKNLHTLVEALALLRRDRPQLTLRIAGRRVDSDYAARLEDAVARHGLGDAVVFAGELAPEALADLYRRCAVFVFPSTVETFGNPLVEAMASGAPVAASRTAATPEVLGGAGITFDPLDAADMSRRIADVLDDPSARAALARRGVERARAFSWPAAARATAAILREAAGRGG